MVIAIEVTKEEVHLCLSFSGQQTFHKGPDSKDFSFSVHMVSVAETQISHCTKSAKYSSKEMA
jgi:hypothetical protein